MELSKSLWIAVLIVALGAGAAWAQSVSGTVTNGTKNKPEAGAEVALVDPMQGMAELATAKSDAQGRFTLKSPGAAQGPRLVRVTHDGINYFKMAPPGTNNVAVNIYDAAKKLDGINGTARVMRVQTTPDGGALQVTELYAVTNASLPPRTLTADSAFEIALPDDAQIDGADAQGPNGQPLPVQPSPVAGKKGVYSFSYALKPGETRFQVGYRLPYKGSANLSPRMTRDFEHFVVMLPQSMKWEPKNAGLFTPMTDQPGATIEVASRVKAGAGDELAFKLSGMGTITEQQDASAETSGGMQGGGAGAQRSGPGGGLGAPIDAPDALEKYRWMILGVLGVVLAGGAYLTVSRAASRRAVAASASEVVSPPVVTPYAASTSNPLLDAMKEELFELEVERQRGQISEEEYKAQKAALDQTLARALAREKRGTLNTA